MSSNSPFLILLVLFAVVDRTNPTNSIAVSVGIEEELQISLFFALTFVFSNKQQLALTSSLKYDSESEFILER